MSCRPIAVSYGIHFDAVLFPLTFRELVGILEKKGYEISPDLPFPLPARRMAATGQIARKGRTSIGVDASGQFLRVHDVSVKSALECFDEIAKALTEDCGVDVDRLAEFYSFVATHEIPTKKEAYEALSKALRFPIYDDIEKIVEEKVWPFALRFGGAGLQVNSDDWFDIDIRPRYERNDSYVVSVVFRSADKPKARRFVETYEEKIQKIVKLLGR